MDKTLLIAVLTLVITPLAVAAVQNLILRLGKKDDLTLARETLLLQREENIEKRRAALQADLETELQEAIRERDRLKGEVEQLKHEKHAEAQPPLF